MSCTAIGDHLRRLPEQEHVGSKVGSGEKSTSLSRPRRDGYASCERMARVPSPRDALAGAHGDHSFLNYLAPVHPRSHPPVVDPLGDRPVGRPRGSRDDVHPHDVFFVSPSRAGSADFARAAVRLAEPVGCSSGGAATCRSAPRAHYAFIVLARARSSGRRRGEYTVVTPSMLFRLLPDETERGSALRDLYAAIPHRVGARGRDGRPDRDALGWR